MIFHTDTFTTRRGPFTVAVNEAGALAGAAFGDLADLRRQLGRVGVAAEFVAGTRRTASARTQIRAYLAGTRRRFDLAIEPAGTPFQQRVWKAVSEIPYGETRTYGEIARRIGSAPRAVGRAVATNPICPVVPCHRVVGADGSLTGFAFGQTLKRRLLAAEQP